MLSYACNQVRIYDTVHGESVATLSEHSSYVLSVAACPDGNRIATGLVCLLFNHLLPFLLLCFLPKSLFDHYLCDSPLLLIAFAFEFLFSFLLMLVLFFHTSVSQDYFFALEA